MPISEDILKPDPSAIIELFELDATAIGDSIVRRFHANMSAKKTDIVWAGKLYTAFPIYAQGFTFSMNGPIARPKMVASNAGGILTALCQLTEDLIGAKLTRHRTLAKYLDATNFVGGNVFADPNAAFPSEIYFVEQKVSETKLQIEFQLANPMDVQGATLPARIVARNYCPWKYRGSECGYTGGPVATAADVATAILANDVCGHRLSSCKLRFGATAELPFGGFPNIGLTR